MRSINHLTFLPFTLTLRNESKRQQPRKERKTVKGHEKEPGGGLQIAPKQKIYNGSEKMGVTINSKTFE